MERCTKPSGYLYGKAHQGKVALLVCLGKLEQGKSLTKVKRSWFKAQI
jgi:hypothetical protein